MAFRALCCRMFMYMHHMDLLQQYVSMREARQVCVALGDQCLLLCQAPKAQNFWRMASAGCGAGGMQSKGTRSTF